MENKVVRQLPTTPVSLKLIKIKKMEYAIFIAIVLTVMTFYHTYKCHKSNYQKLEDYLNRETNWIVRNLVILWIFVIFFTVIGVVIYLGGNLVKIFL